MRSGTAMILVGAVGASGCVLAVDDRFTVEEPVTRIELRLGHGQVRVEAGSSVVEVDAELAGPVTGTYGHEVVDGVLHLDYECGEVDLCGGDIDIRAPSGVDVWLTVGAGDVAIVGMAGEVRADVGTGAITGRALAGSSVEVTTGTGSATLTLVERPTLVAAIVGTGDIELTVPAGSYALELDAAAGTITVGDITADPSADATLVAVAGAGAITIDGS